MSQKTASLVLFVFWAVLVAGCERKPRVPSSTATSSGSGAQQEHLAAALDFVSRLEEFDPEKGMVQTAYHLNRWVGDLDEDVEWTEDPLVERLPNVLRRSAPLSDLGRRQYTLDDVRFLREASWMHSLSQRLAQAVPDARLQAWLGKIERSQGEQQAYELGLACRLFDWTIRNIQLEALPPVPKLAAGPTAPGKKAASDGRPPPEQAIPGPGYTAFPWQTMLFGRGDAYQRARVFLLLARQQQLEVVLLAFDDPRATPQPFPWLPAVLIDDQLYLFDTVLGMPIPAADGGVATLQQVRENPQLLRSLDVGEQLPYAPARLDLEQVVALLDAAPEFLSLRMKRIAAQRRSGPPLVVSIAPSEIAERVRNCAGIKSVALWTVPVETGIYRAALERRAERDPEVQRQKMAREWIFEGFHPLVNARRLYFRGVFENHDGKEGAKALYLQARLPDATIAQMDTSPEVQRSLGLIRDRENDQQWQARLKNHQFIAQQIKQAASYWLGLIHYESGRYDVARDWFKTRTLEAGEGNAWIPGARYNLARTYEALGDLQQARELLLLDDSPQKHGSLLLARQYRARLEEQPAPPAAP